MATEGGGRAVKGKRETRAKNGWEEENKSYCYFLFFNSSINFTNIPLNLTKLTGGKNHQKFTTSKMNGVMQNK